MVTKKLVWVDSDGVHFNTELPALASDVLDQLGPARLGFNEDWTELTPEQVAAIDAIHEYAHRPQIAETRHSHTLLVGAKYFTVGDHESVIEFQDDDGNFVDADGDRFTPDGKHLYGTAAGGYGARINYNIDWRVK